MSGAETPQMGVSVKQVDTIYNVAIKNLWLFLNLFPLFFFDIISYLNS